MCLTERFFVMAEVRDHLQSLGDADWLIWDARCMLLYQHLFWRLEAGDSRFIDFIRTRKLACFDKTIE